MNTKTLRPILENAEDNALALAIAVLRGRIRQLGQDDQNDLYELLPALFSRDKEEEESAFVAVREIMDQSATTVSKANLPEEPGSELQNWTDFVSKRIREEREKADLTQEQLAEKADLPQSHISRLENGQHSPTAKTIQKIAEALGVSPERFDPSA